MKNLSKRILSTCLTLAFSFALTAPVFADKANAEIYMVSGVPGTHPYRYTTNDTIVASQQIVLNAYCETAPVDGTPVTTWSYTGSDTQQWSGGDTVTAYAKDSSGQTYRGYVISSDANPDVALNINRSTSTPEVNTYSLIGNKFADVVIYRSGTSYYVEPRVNAGRRYLQCTSSIPNSGGGQYMRWGLSATPFYRFDIPYGVFT